MRTSCRLTAAAASLTLALTLTSGTALASSKAHLLQQQKKSNHHLLHQQRNAKNHLLLQQQSKKSFQHLQQQQALKNKYLLQQQQQRPQASARGTEWEREGAITFVQPVIPGATGALGMPNAPIRRALPATAPVPAVEPTLPAPDAGVAPAPSQQLLPDEPVLVR